MNRRDAAEEPSMEDILASIRKIIADEPASPAANSLPLPQAPTLTVPAVRDPPAVSPVPQASLTARLNDVFGPGTVVPGALDRTDPRPFNRTAALPGQPLRPAPGRSVMDDDLGDLLADGPVAPLKADAGLDSHLRRASPQASMGPLAPAPRLTELRQVPAPFDPLAAPVAPIAAYPSGPASTPAPAAKSEPVVIASMAAAAPRPVAPAIAPSPSLTPPHPVAPSVGALGADVPPVTRTEPVVLASSKPFIAPAPSGYPAARVAPAMPPAAADPELPVGISPSTLEFLGAAPSVVDSPSIVQPQAASTPAPAVDLFSPASAVVIAAPPEAPSAPAFEVIASPIRQPLPVAAADKLAVTPEAAREHGASVAASAEPAPTLGAAFIPAAPAAEPPAAFVNEPSTIDADDAVASALGALAAGLAASVHKPEIVAVAVEVTPSAASTPVAPASDAEPANPVVVTPAANSVFSSPGDFTGGAALTPVSTSTLDDTAAELLRPMLRQWLDDNMPRIVERALRIELAEAVDLTPKATPKP